MGWVRHLAPNADGPVTDTVMTLVVIAEMLGMCAADPSSCQIVSWKCHLAALFWMFWSGIAAGVGSDWCCTCNVQQAPRAQPSSPLILAYVYVDS
jgi:hypothetical protein